MKLPIEMLLKTGQTHLWQFTTVALVVVAIVIFFARRRPHFAYVLLMLVMIKAAIPPLIECPFAIFRSSAAPIAAEPDGDVIPYGRVQTETHGATARLGEKDRRMLSSIDGPRAEVALRARSISPFLVGIFWLIGALLVLVLRCVQAAATMRLLRRARGDNREDLSQLLQRLARALGVQEQVRLLISPDGLGPAAIGILRPTIVLPMVMVGHKTADELRPILAHELIHIRRYDVAAALFQMVMQALWWFHPLAHWTHRRLIYERERCTDDEVLASGVCTRDEYAQGLLAVLRLNSQLIPSASAAVGARPFEMTRQRLERIMSSQIDLGQTRLWCWIVLFAGALLSLPSGSSAQKLPPATRKPIVPDERVNYGETRELRIHANGWGNALANLDKGITIPALATISDFRSIGSKITRFKREDFYFGPDKGKGKILELIVSDEDARLWEASHGVDLSFGGDTRVKGNLKLFGRDLIFIPTSNEMWDRTPAHVLNELDQQPAPAATSMILDGSASLPKTFLFKTREKSKGIAQVTSFRPYKPGHKWFESAVIRYKFATTGQLR
jgi:beta-lactamase regulating signal transducer with metallopeptidase domain